MVPGDDKTGSASRHSVFIDNCAWDVFFAAGLDLAAELPAQAYDLWITREAEFEIASLAGRKDALKAYVDDAVRRCSIRTHSYFGFYEEQHASDEQRVGGFDQGWWISADELDFIHRLKAKIGATKKATTKLYPNEADLSLAARSLHSIVITDEKKERGPLHIAKKEGGKVVSLRDFPSSGLSLRVYIEARI